MAVYAINCHFRKSCPVLYDQAVALVLKSRRASISLVQRQLRSGNRAARLIEQMERAGLVSAMQSYGNREVLVKGAECGVPGFRCAASELHLLLCNKKSVQDPVAAEPLRTPDSASVIRRIGSNMRSNASSATATGSSLAM